jgi:predicted methyltransferase
MQRCTGYFTRVFAQAVGPSGKVAAVVPDSLAASKPAVVTTLQSIVTDEGYANIEVVVGAPANIAPPSSVDVVWTAQNYHDFHGAKSPKGTAAVVNQAAFSALKPGGRYLVIEHKAVAGSGSRDVDTLHRIDIQLVKDEVKAAGFVLEEESEVLANPADDRSKSVFDPEIRGRTDQVALRFVKPKK